MSVKDSKPAGMPKNHWMRASVLGAALALLGGCNAAEESRSDAESIAEPSEEQAAVAEAAKGNEVKRAHRTRMLRQLRKLGAPRRPATPPSP